MKHGIYESKINDEVFQKGEFVFLTTVNTALDVVKVKFKNKVYEIDLDYFVKNFKWLGID